MDAAVFVTGLAALVVIAALIFALTGPSDLGGERVNHRQPPAE